LYLTETNKFIIVFQFYNTTGYPLQKKTSTYVDTYLHLHVQIKIVFTNEIHFCQ